ncbi:GATA zinc finger domain-containing protein 7-like [Plodia interpunctella]|uniref:GATA zinc finger domain-containing protein 7-like n=1 Tax=Plodia interpunctella TaxID=58824 RepID=UPI0023682E50|nr:GATA zinc finger domain-containing protein 7-like [Plodia interpunctella]
MAWPPVIHISFILSILYLKGASGQQNGFPNQVNAHTPLGSPLPKNLNRMSKCPFHQKLLNGKLYGNLQPPVNLQQQQLNLQQAALQQQLNIQQANLQQGMNIPQANLAQVNMPPNFNQLNLQQGNVQQLGLQQMGNLPQLNLQPGNSQQLNLQQLTPNLPLGLQTNNFQQSFPPSLSSLQLANNHVPDISVASSPMQNNQFSNIPPHIPQQLSDAGRSAQIASSMPCNFNLPTQSVPMGYTTNQPVLNPSPFTAISDLGTINNQQYALVAVPIQNQRSVNVVQPNIPNPISGTPNQVTIIKSVQPQGYFDPIVPTPELDQNKLSLISSLISDTAPAQFTPGSLLNGNSILGAALSKSGSKSSNLQALLPLIFNLLKEKNNGCTCHHCGCTNNKQPQIFSGYANSNNNSEESTSETSDSNDDVEETTESPEAMTEAPEHQKSIKENTINNTDSREQELGNDSDNYDDEE